MAARRNREAGSGSPTRPRSHAYDSLLVPGDKVGIGAVHGSGAHVARSLELALFPRMADLSPVGIALLRSLDVAARDHNQAVAGRELHAIHAAGLKWEAEATALAELVAKRRAEMRGEELKIILGG